VGLAAEQFKNGHTHGNAVRYLTVDKTMWKVEEGLVELDTHVDRTGVHDDHRGVIGGKCRRDCISTTVLVDIRNMVRDDPLSLNPQ